MRERRERKGGRKREEGSKEGRKDKAQGGREGGRSKFSYFVVSARGKDKPTNYTEYLVYSWRVQCIILKCTATLILSKRREGRRERETAKVGKEVTRYTVPVYGEQLRV